MRQHTTTRARRCRRNTSSVMNLHSLLQQRASEGRPVGVVLIGAGKFGSMYLSQARRTPGIRIRAICDLAPDRARASLRRTGWTEEEIGRAVITDDTAGQIAHAETEVVIDATGNPAVGVRNVLACCEYRKHVVMVNVEADALAGPL